VIVPTAAGGLHVTMIGEGKALLFWPSLFLDAAMWADQVAVLKDRYRCILIDPPGQGASAPREGLITLSQCGDALVDVMNALQIERAGVVGCSWGGMAAINGAARHPQRVAAIAVLNSTARAPTFFERIQAGVVSRILRRSGFSPWLCKEIVKGFLSPAAMAARPDLVARLTEDLQRQNPVSCAWTALSLLKYRAGQSALLPKATCPALVVSGGKDRGFPPSHGRAMAGMMANARFETIAGTGHLAPVESPAAITALALEFFTHALSQPQ
jgi:3-oxoadipate enol-lactonase